ncbi:MAG: PqqD family protein [Deltaproteobacteria bacterium]
MPPLQLDTVVRRNPKQIAAEADGEVLMMNVEAGQYYGLNEVASFIWTQLDRPRTIGDLCASIQEEFDVDRDRCVADALRFVAIMVQDGLAETVEPGGFTAG